jgi:hypothetical protein
MLHDTTINTPMTARGRLAGLTTRPLPRRHPHGRPTPPTCPNTRPRQHSHAKALRHGDDGRHTPSTDPPTTQRLPKPQPTRRLFVEPKVTSTQSGTTPPPPPTLDDRPRMGGGTNHPTSAQAPPTPPTNSTDLPTHSAKTRLPCHGPRPRGRRPSHPTHRPTHHPTPPPLETNTHSKPC